MNKAWRRAQSSDLCDENKSGVACAHTDDFARPLQRPRVHETDRKDSVEAMEEASHEDDSTPHAAEMSDEFGLIDLPPAPYVQLGALHRTAHGVRRWTALNSVEETATGVTALISSKGPQPSHLRQAT